MLDQVQHYIDVHYLAPPGARILVGVSGGVDSMVLLHILQKLDFKISCAHVNYRLRGEEADGDELLVEQHCNTSQIPLYVHRVTDDFLQDKTTSSFQERARDERYAFFLRTAIEQGIKWVAVAHHVEDQVETVLMRLMRGSGIEGVAGMSPQRRLSPHANIELVRPLLNCTRKQIEDFALDKGIDWREDVSNQDTNYLRNAVRHKLLGTIRTSFGAPAVRNIAKSAEILQGYVASSIKPALTSKFSQIQAGKYLLDTKKLLCEHDVWQERLILEACKRWVSGIKANSHHASAIRKLLEAQVGRRVIIGDTSVWRDRSALRFVANDDTKNDAAVEYLVEANTCIHLAKGDLETAIVVAAEVGDLNAPPNILHAAAESLVFPLMLRKWEHGDRFVPYGMKGHKLVSDFLTDIKVAPHERAEVMVLESAGEIIWVVGYRAGASAKVDADTEHILVCKYIRR